MNLVHRSGQPAAAGATASDEPVFRMAGDLEQIAATCRSIAGNARRNGAAAGCDRLLSLADDLESIGAECAACGDALRSRNRDLVRAALHSADGIGERAVAAALTLRDGLARLNQQRTRDGRMDT